MAFRFMDSFAGYTVATMTSKWTNISSPVFGTGRTGANGLVWGNSSLYVSKVLDNQTTWIVGCAMKSNHDVSNLPIISFLDAGSSQFELRTSSTDGSIKVTR